MIHLIRSNSFTDILGAPQWFLDYIARHLSIPIEVRQKKGARFGKVWWHEGEPWGSLVHDNRVAAGLTPYVEKLAAHYGLQHQTRDIRVRPEEQLPWWSVNVKWRPYQDDIHQKTCATPTGIINAVPRSGKTLMAARVIDSLALPALYIAPSVAIVRQTYNVFCEHFGESMVARLDGSAKPHERDIEKPIVISTTPSAVRQSRDWYDTRGVLIIDESHHSAAETYHRINHLAQNVHYRYLFTGTNFRSGDDTLAMEAICSQVIHRVTVDDLVPKYLAPPRVFFAPVKGPKVSAEDWRAAYDKGIVDYEPRNNLIVNLATMLSQDNALPTIVLVRRRKHANMLAERIPDAVAVKGGEAALTNDSIEDFLAGKVQVLVGTTVLGEGVDVPRAAALIYASGGAEGVSMLQSYFRPLTAHAGKERAYIYDFIDSQHRTLRRHSKQRIDFARLHLGDCVNAP
jgi:superfamily II DNA or RNA helicase